MTYVLKCLLMTNNRQNIHSGRLTHCQLQLSLSEHAQYSVQTVHFLSVSRSTTFLKRQMRGCGSGLWSPRLHFSSVQSDGAGVYPSMQWGSLDRLPVHHRVKRQTDAALHTDGRVSDHRENSWETSRKWSWNTSCCDSPRYVSDTTHHVLMRSVHSAGLNSWSLYQEKIIKR